MVELCVAIIAWTMFHRHGKTASSISVPCSWSVRIGVRCVHEFMYDAFSVYANNNEFCVRKMAAWPTINRDSTLAASQSATAIQILVVVKCYDIIYSVRSARTLTLMLSRTNIFTFIVVVVVHFAFRRCWCFKHGRLASHVLHKFASPTLENVGLPMSSVVAVTTTTHTHYTWLTAPVRHWSDKCELLRPLRACISKCFSS